MNETGTANEFYTPLVKKDTRASVRASVRACAVDFGGVDSKSLFRGLPEVKIQQKIAF